jgi:hypothetical protein
MDDQQIAQMLDERGGSWRRLFLLGDPPAISRRNPRGNLDAIIIEDDSLWRECVEFLRRRGARSFASPDEAERALGIAAGPAGPSVEKRISIYLVLGDLPLLLYPFVVIAGVMSLAGHVSGDEPLLLLAVARSFIWGSLAYPAVYIPCLVVACALKQNRKKAALRFSVAPVLYLLALIALLGVWWVAFQKYSSNEHPQPTPR